MIRELSLDEFVPIRLSPTPTICMAWRRVAREGDKAGMDVSQREDLSFPRALPEFQRLFPDGTACAAYIAGDVTAPTYAELYSGDWEHPRCSGCG